MDLFDEAAKQQKKKHGFYPYDEANLARLPHGEQVEALSLVRSFTNCGYRGRKMAEGRLNRLTDLNAKGAMIRNTNGPSWMGGDHE